MIERQTGGERARDMKIVEERGKERKRGMNTARVRSERNRDDKREKERGKRRREGKRVAERG